MYHRWLVLLLGLGIVGELHCSRELYEGSKCYNSDEPGICRRMPECPPALRSVKAEGRHGFKRCGWEGDIELVCCPSSTGSLPSHEGDDDDTQVRSTDLSGKSKKACERYSKLPIILQYHIVEGDDAGVGEFPHMVALGFYNQQEKMYLFNCGGTLISEQFIITAAHCIINIDRMELKIARLGVIEVPPAIEKPDSQLDYDVINVTIHQKYNWKLKINDIALAKLGRKVTFTDNIRPACLYWSNDDPGLLLVSGWGTTGLGEARSNILQKAALTPVSLNECNRTYLSRAKKNVIRSQLCASDDRSDACQGDSGGPLQVLGNGSLFNLVGVTSYGIGCGTKYPGIYTRISSYVDWIEKIVWP